MKNYCTFVAFLTGTILMVLVSVVIFIATNTAVCAAEYRLSISNGCRALKPVIVPVRTEKDSLSSFKYFNFSFMTGTMKNQSGAKYSNSTLTPTGAKTVSTSTLFHSEYTEFTEQLGIMNKWFLDFRETVNPNDDHILDALFHIEGALGDAVHNIGELVSIEFRENIYYKNL
jgi:hypothetical protein